MVKKAGPRFNTYCVVKVFNFVLIFASQDSIAEMKKGLLKQNLLKVEQEEVSCIYLCKILVSGKVKPFIVVVGILFCLYWVILDPMQLARDQASIYTKTSDPMRFYTGCLTQLFA